MATASSAQREPSMEEILASIRRIIEDSDSGRKQADESVEVHAVAEPEVPEPAAPEVDAFRAELRAAPADARPVTLADVKAQLTTPTPPRADPVKPAVTLAEIGARIAAEQDGAGRAEADAVTATWRQDGAAAAQPPREIDRAMAARFPEPEGTAHGEDVTAQDKSSSNAEAAPEPERVPARAAADVQRSSLVSEQTSRQVAAAFGELSEAFASRSRKSFDEMAEDMLRPMLQDWLDNNLPTLVERLVREEIERVARGG